MGRRKRRKNDWEAQERARIGGVIGPRPGYQRGVMTDLAMRGEGLDPNSPEALAWDELKRMYGEEIIPRPPAPSGGGAGGGGLPFAALAAGLGLLGGVRLGGGGGGLDGVGAKAGAELGMGSLAEVGGQLGTGRFQDVEQWTQPEAALSMGGAPQRAGASLEPVTTAAIIGAAASGLSAAGSGISGSAASKREAKAMKEELDQEREQNVYDRLGGFAGYLAQRNDRLRKAFGGRR